MIDREMAFRESLLAVLEAMFFESLKTEPFETGEVPEAALCTQVEFIGSQAGHMQVATEERTAVALAGNFLGLGEGDEEAADRPALARFTVGELANICCGSFLSRLFPNGTFAIRPPEVLPAPPEAGGTAWLAMPMGGGTVYFRLQWGKTP
jgi:CheY-specific phosphatase CheX